MVVFLCCYGGGGVGVFVSFFIFVFSGEGFGIQIVLMQLVYYGGNLVVGDDDVFSIGGVDGFVQGWLVCMVGEDEFVIYVMLVVCVV